MADSGGKLSPSALWRRLRTAMYPERGCDAEARRALEEEASESDARIARWAAGVTMPLNGIALVVVLRSPTADPASTAWAFWIVGASAVLAAIAILTGVVAWRRRPAALYRALGTLVGVVGLLGAAARSANAQRAHPNITMFVIAAFATAFFLRMR